MKKVLTMLLALAMVASLAACGSTGGSTSTPSSSAATSGGPGAEEGNGLNTVETGKLIMATNAQFPPYEMVADNSAGYQETGYEGIDVEIAWAIAEKLGLELEIDDMDFSAAVNAPAQGKADMCMAGLTVNDERKTSLDFTDTYATGIQVIIVPEGSAIATVDDLEGKMIGTQEGTTGYNYCSASPEDGGYGEDHVIAYTNGATAVQALLAGKVDCVIIDKAPAQEYVAANPTLKILDTQFTSEDYAIAVAKGNSELLDAINGALNELITDGTVQSIVDSYINADGTPVADASSSEVA